MDRMTERRRDRRIPLGCKVGIKLPHSTQAVVGTCVDLSVGGLTIRSTHVPQMDEVFEIAVLPPDMGGPFDFFGERSHYDAEGLAPEHAANRARLREAMIAGGFEPYELEWWHFTYPLGDDARAVDAPVR